MTVHGTPDDAFAAALRSRRGTAKMAAVPNLADRAKMRDRLRALANKEGYSITSRLDGPEDERYVHFTITPREKS